LNPVLKTLIEKRDAAPWGSLDRANLDREIMAWIKAELIRRGAPEPMPDLLIRMMHARLLPQ